MAIERISFGDADYSGSVAAIHMARYAMARNLCKDRKVLDIACGEGYGSRLLLDWGAEEVVGLDISSEAIESARRNFGARSLRYLIADASKADQLLAGERFDLIVSFETLEHLAAPQNYLSAIASLRALEGIVIISCPNDWFFSPDPDTGNEYHARKYHMEEFVDLVTTHLGTPSAVGVGTPCIGWVNLPAYDTAVWYDAKFQKEMLNHRDGCSLLLPAEANTLTIRNGNYYWASWGIGSNELVSLATLPTSTDALHLIIRNNNPVIAFLKQRWWNMLTAIPKSLAFIARRVMHRLNGKG